MARILKKILPVLPQTPKEEEDDDDFSLSYSFAVEYTGPPISREIPQAVPIDVKHIPIAAKVASSSLLNDVPLTVIQPIVKSRSFKKRQSKKAELGSNRLLDSNDVSLEMGCVNSDESRHSLSNRIRSSNQGEDANGVSCRSNLSDRIKCSDETGLCNGCDSSDQESRSFQVLQVGDNRGEDETESDQSSGSVSSEIFSGREDDCIEAILHHVKRPSAVTFCDPESSNSGKEESDVSDVGNDIPARQMAVRTRKKGTCYYCMKGNRFIPKEMCIVCGAKYCYNCVMRAMGSMPEGRKCVSCIGQKIEESMRRNLGKSSRMLKQLFPVTEVEKIMRAEKSCKVNQLPPELVHVNSQPLSQQELSLLQTCKFPPKKLKPGYYWYDNVSGFWGKEGQKPCQIISPKLNIGGRISKDASNGNTNIMINNREITKQELLMLQLIGVKCEGGTHFWVSADGSFQEEGMNHVKGKIWEKNMVKLICMALSLPTPPAVGSLSAGEANTVVAKSLDQKSFLKLLLVGCGKSGTSTIFKHAKIIYNNQFSEDERQKIKCMIQSNLYGYLGILLEGCERFEEESLIRKKRHLSNHCSSSDNDGHENKTIYSISPKLKPFSDWLLQTMVSGNLENKAATCEYGPLVEELWYDAAIQATYSRRDELELLPRVATYFLERAVEISKKDYEPSDIDILYAEGITSSNGLSSMEFSFPCQPEGNSSNSEKNEHDISHRHRYQLIRVNPRVLGGNCKWLEMFEDVDMVLFCVSLIDYDEYVEACNGVRINRMMATKQLFERIVMHQKFKNKKFLLILNKFDLLEERIEGVPLNRCKWFHDFNPVIGHNPSACSSSSARSTNTPLAHRAFQYIAVKFKRLFSSLKDGKLFVSLVTALEADNVDEALRYAREILKWNLPEEPMEVSSSSIEASTSSHFHEQESTATN